MKAPTETALVKDCLDLLRLRGVTAWRNNTTGVRRTDKTGREFWAFHGAKGAADILGVLPARRHGRSCGCGVALAVECKMPGQKPTIYQSAFLEQIRAAGGVALCVTSTEELDAALAALTGRA